LEGLNSSAEIKKTFKVDKNKVFGLIKDERSEWGLKRDIKRVILYESFDQKAIINRVGALTPSEAILISLFDGKRTNGEVIKLASDLFHVEEDIAERNIAFLQHRWAIALEEKPENHRYGSPQYNPRDFVIPAAEVDMEQSRFYTPIGLVFQVSGNCMRDCLYCNIERIPDNEDTLISLKRWDEIAEECKELDVVSITLTGGDPFCNKNLLKIVESFTKRGIHPFIATKSLVTKDRAKKLADLGIRRMQVSIDAPNKEVVDYLTGVEGSFDHAVTSIKNLKEAGIDVSTNTVVTVHNALLLPELGRFLTNLGVKWMKNSQFGRSYFLDGQDELFVPEKTGRWIENKIKQLHDENKINRTLEYSFVEDHSAIKAPERKEKFPERSLCTGGRWGFTCIADGRVIPCDEIPVNEETVVGNLSHQSILEVWNSPRFNMYLKPPREPFKGTVCYDCETFDVCHDDKGRCFRDSLKSYGSLYAPAPACWKAGKGIRLT